MSAIRWVYEFVRSIAALAMLVLLMPLWVPPLLVVALVKRLTRPATPVRRTEGSG